MNRILSVFILQIWSLVTYGQFRDSALIWLSFGDEINVNIDCPEQATHMQKKPLILILYALPNGSNTEQTMGRKMSGNLDWKFDIQHIRAQTEFIRKADKSHRYAVAYLENRYLSWPHWKARHADHAKIVLALVDSLRHFFRSDSCVVFLNGHSGGGRFIFSYLDAVKDIPSYIKRISFLDSDYGYEDVYLGQISRWLREVKDAHLNVFAYNDSVALYNGKPFVSATGGTWYRSHQMLYGLSDSFLISRIRNDSLIYYQTADKKVQFFFKTNPGRIIYHTIQVVRNGFIHSIFCGTRYSNKGYRYFGERAFDRYIR
jgi:hypothetical protein